jgi:ATP-binding cassette, subfamily B, bacterial
LNAEFTLPERYPTDRRSPARWVFSHGIRQWPLLLLAFFGAFINAATAAETSVLIGQAFTAILASPPDLPRLVQIALLIAFINVGRGLLQFARNFGFEVIAQRLERNVRDELYKSLLGKSMTFHNLQSVGDTMARATNDVREVNYLFSPGINLVIGSLFFLIMPLIVAPSYQPVLIVTPIIFIILFGISLWAYLRELSPVTNQVRATFGQLNSRLSEALDGIETVKASSQEKREVARFNHNARNYRNAMVKQGDIEAKFIPFLLYSVALAAGFLHSLILYRQGLLNVGQVIGYFGVLAMLDFPTWSSLFAYSQISLGLAGAKRILELMNRENNLDQNLTGKNEKVTGAIEFREVTFGYDGQEPVLDKINFTVKPGQTIAIVGQTGAGKSTLVKLVNRTHDATAGKVMVDGLDVKDWNLEILRRNISIIEQDIFLFSRSVAANIAFGKPDATEDEIITAAKAAQAHEFITTFSEGYQTIIGERGVTLSGGQRQRLALARAFLTDPKILILDDSTSAIDSATEDKIQRAIYLAARGRTTLIITHRLSQIRWADQIIVLRNGRIAAIGSHELLMNSCDPYRRLFSE